MENKLTKTTEAVKQEDSIIVGNTRTLRGRESSVRLPTARNFGGEKKKKRYDEKTSHESPGS